MACHCRYFSATASQGMISHKHGHAELFATNIGEVEGSAIINQG